MRGRVDHVNGVKNFLLFLILLVAAVSILLLVRFNKENTDVTKTLEQERYGRMSAEEELQRGEYRIKKLEADLQTAQMRSSRVLESLDKLKDENVQLKADCGKYQHVRAELDVLHKDLEAAKTQRAALQARVKEMEQVLRASQSRAAAAERKLQQQAAAAEAMAAEGKK